MARLHCLLHNNAVALPASHGLPSILPCAVPQFVLEAAIAEGRGGEVKVLCTQPRRLTTIGEP
jgi:HrpA-like RNA helicase